MIYKNNGKKGKWFLQCESCTEENIIEFATYEEVCEFYQTNNWKSKKDGAGKYIDRCPNCSKDQIIFGRVN